ncbi:MAG: M23 family metallopeptidase [Flavisolibacter sp.]
MRKLSILVLLIAMFAASCTSVANKIFKKQTPRENYEDKIEDRPEGRLWKLASEKALVQPVNISLPYSQEGYFDTDHPRSLGLKFTAKRGEQIRFQLDKLMGVGKVMYADLFKEDVYGSSIVLTADTGTSTFQYDIEENGNYILRLQPELLAGGDYNLSITSGASLGFPVLGNKARIGSFWGAGRDGGKRSHEGIDIFAPKRTPVVAAADGYVTSVKEGGIGGKTVWLRLQDKNLTLYYAHLDEQLVKMGQFVKKGETLGLVGNTGNAITTPHHLHFGIYTIGGAIDPLVFVDEKEKQAPKIPNKEISAKALKLTRSFKSDSIRISAQSLIIPLAVTAKGYIAELPGGQQVIMPFDQVKVVEKPSVNKMAGKPISDTKG